MLEFHWMITNVGGGFHQLPCLVCWQGHDDHGVLLIRCQGAEVGPAPLTGFFWVSIGFQRKREGDSTQSSIDTDR